MTRRPQPGITTASWRRFSWLLVRVAFAHIVQANRTSACLQRGWHQWARTHRTQVVAARGLAWLRRYPDRRWRA